METGDQNFRKKDIQQCSILLLNFAHLCFVLDEFSHSIVDLICQIDARAAAADLDEPGHYFCWF